jgi:hypothetical protein
MNHRLCGQQSRVFEYFVVAGKMSNLFFWRRFPQDV